MNKRMLCAVGIVFLVGVCTGADNARPEPAKPEPAAPVPAEGGPAETKPAEMSGQDVMKRNYEQMTTKNFRSDVVMELMVRGGRVQTRHLKRLSKTDAKNQETSLLIFTDPPTVRHTALLIVEREEKNNDVWFYIPAVRKTKRISGSNLQRSYMGTEFTFKDLEREKVTPDRNRYEMIESEELGEVDHYVLDAFPVGEQEASEQGYQKRRLWIRKDNYLTSKVVFHNKKGEYLKTLVGSDMKEIGRSGKFRYHTLTMTNAKGVKTIIQLNMIRINEEEPKDQYFTKAFLTRKK